MYPKCCAKSLPNLSMQIRRRSHDFAHMILKLNIVRVRVRVRVRVVHMILKLSIVVCFYSVGMLCTHSSVRIILINYQFNSDSNTTAL